MAVEYFHPKTTPNTPIRRAVRMSVALPGNGLIFYSIALLPYGHAQMPGLMSINQSLQF